MINVTCQPLFFFQVEYLYLEKISFSVFFLSGVQTSDKGSLLFSHIPRREHRKFSKRRLTAQYASMNQYLISWWILRFIAVQNRLWNNGQIEAWGVPSYRASDAGHLTSGRPLGKSHVCELFLVWMITLVGLFLWCNIFKEVFLSCYFHHNQNSKPIMNIMIALK